MPFKKIRFKRIGTLYNPITPPPPIIEPPITPPTPPIIEPPIPPLPPPLPVQIDTYRGVVIYYNMDQQYEWKINGVLYLDTDLNTAKLRIDAILDIPTPPPPPPPGKNYTLTNIADWEAYQKTISPGDIINLTGELVSDRTVNFTVPAIYKGGKFRTRLSTMTVSLAQLKAPVSLNNVTFSGLGDDGRDQVYPYQLVIAYSQNGIKIENCIFEHHQQYLVQLSDSDNFIIKGNTFRYGQNGFSTYGTCKGGLIENNTFYDCSQGPIKLRGCTGTKVTGNHIELAYNYWRDFLHFKYPGPDGRGEVGHSSTGCQGIYFGVTDPQPCFNCDVSGNTIIDSSNHALESYGCWFPHDAGTVYSQGNLFHNNTILNAYWGIRIINRTPYPMKCYDNMISGVVKNDVIESGGLI